MARVCVGSGGDSHSLVRTYTLLLKIFLLFHVLLEDEVYYGVGVGVWAG